MSSQVEQLHSRAKSLVEEVEQGGGNTSCIEEAIALDREALEHCPSGHPMRSISLALLANHLCHRYRLLGAMTDLEEAIVLDREALDLRPPGNPDRTSSLNNLAGRLFMRYNQLADVRDLNEAIILCRDAMDPLPRGHPDRSAPLKNLVTALSIRFQKLRSMQDLNDAITLCKEALDVLQQGHPHRSAPLTNLAFALSARYKQLGRVQDLNEAIAFGREALDLHPQGHPDRSAPLTNLSLALSDRYNELGTIQDLNEAIVLDRQVVELSPEGNPHRPSSLDTLATDLVTRYKQLGETQDLDEATLLCREALDICSEGHPDRPRALHCLSLCLFNRYRQLGAMKDLNEAIALDQAALDLRPQGHPSRSVSLNNIAVNLITRYNELGDIQDLNGSIALGREALDLFPPGHPSRSTSLSNLTGHLTIRYKQHGTMQDLDEAIVLEREALSLRPKGHPHRPLSLNNLSIALSARHKQLRGMQDLNEAIFLGVEALRLCPRGHPDRHMSLVNLSTNLFTRHREEESMQDLDTAIALDREALHIYPQGHPSRLLSLNNLANRLCSRFGHTKEVQDINEAIGLSQEALEPLPPGHPLRPQALNNHALNLLIRHKHLGTMQDLDDAIALGREAFDLCPQGHPDRSYSLCNIVDCLSYRFSQSKELKDQEEAFRLYSQLVHVSEVVSFGDLTAAKDWIRAAEDIRHPTLVLAYETSLRLIVHHLATLLSLPQHLIILKELTASVAVDAFSACLREAFPTRAIELLEQGRGIFWSQLTRLRSPLEDVIASGATGKTLADEFSRLAALIRNALNATGEHQHENVHRLNLDLQAVVTKIRELPGLARFLLPSLFSDLQHAAKGGPVIVVNASKYSCDALVILSDRDPIHIPLRITQKDVRRLATELRTLTRRATVDNVTRDLAAFLRRLWVPVVGPIIDVLLTIHPTGSRIWWCPTAEFSQLPLHAAGPFRKGQLNLPDIYVSSYTPTLTALIRARQPDPSEPTNERTRFIAIGQGQATGQRALPSVVTELNAIERRIGHLTTFTRIQGTDARIARVVQELGKNAWVHLSCHGLPNRTQPFDAAFALQDGHLTVHRLIGCDLENPAFAYLSACHTTVGDQESPDEVIHLASAMQFAGFRSVIGTMWAVEDEGTSKIVSTFYKFVVDGDGRLDHTRAASALNKTMKSVDVPFDQRVLYIHLGA